ncbi:hypothetical protein KM043_003035 [Ampulex compressa]|nr:hypothetical protein KM043_003035 [Ampulex compressa]
MTVWRNEPIVRRRPVALRSRANPLPVLARFTGSSHLFGRLTARGGTASRSSDRGAVIVDRDGKPASSRTDSNSTFLPVVESKEERDLGLLERFVILPRCWASLNGQRPRRSLSPIE